MIIDERREIMITYGEMARKLGFGEDWSGFLTWGGLWSDMPEITDEVPEAEVPFYRQAAGRLGKADELVLKGAELIEGYMSRAGDSESPPWRKRIDLDSLDINSCEGCVLGQLFGTYSDGLRRLGLNVGWHHGFSDQPMAGGATSTDLHVAWTRLLTPTRQERVLASGEPWD